MNDKLKNEVLLSAQRALLGQIYCEIRAIAIGFSNKVLHVIFYLEREPIDIDYDVISDVTGEIISDFYFPEDFEEIVEECIYTEKSISELNKLNFWMYIKKEDNKK